MASTDLMNRSLSKFWEMMDREAWRAAVQGVTKGWTQLNNNNVLFMRAPPW